MTIDELTADCLKFADYLKANGMRPIAIIVHACNDRGDDPIVHIGLAECVDETCIRVLAYHKGFDVIERGAK